MKTFLLSNDRRYAQECPFGLTFISSDQLKVPQTHLMFVTSDSTCLVDMASGIPAECLPIATKAVRIVPILPTKCYDDKILAQLMHMYPTHAAALRRSYIFGEESFNTFIKGLEESYQWDTTIKVHLGGTRCLA